MFSTKKCGVNFNLSKNAMARYETSTRLNENYIRFNVNIKGLHSFVYASYML